METFSGFETTQQVIEFEEKKKLNQNNLITTV